MTEGSQRGRQRKKAKGLAKQRSEQGNAEGGRNRKVQLVELVALKCPLDVKSPMPIPITGKKASKGEKGELGRWLGGYEHSLNVHEDRSLDPQTLCKKLPWLCTPISPALRKGEAVLVEGSGCQSTYRFNGRPVSRK